MSSIGGHLEHPGGVLAGALLALAEPADVDVLGGELEVADEHGAEDHLVLPHRQVVEADDVVDLDSQRLAELRVDTSSDLNPSLATFR